MCRPLRAVSIAFVAIAACTPSSARKRDSALPVYADVHAAVDAPRLIATLRELAGDRSVTIDGDTFAITERYSDTGRARFRRYWRAAYEAMGLTVRAIAYQDPDSSRPGVDLEAVLPGRSPDSVVVIVPYDSLGPPGHETENPGADDDMTGMAIQLETARALLPYRGRLAHTVRFVATDEAKLGRQSGARAYARQIAGEAARAGFALVAAIDDGPSGWNCMPGGPCEHVDDRLTVDVFSCGERFDSAPLGDLLEAVVRARSTLDVRRDCLGAAGDHDAMWAVGVPSVRFTEHRASANPHVDLVGGDTFAAIDTAYFTAIARPAITFAAEVVGIAPE
ncbi:MAG: M20/M25/M40 family metallo-hydrolase [Deltaproteobacteria bacterium]|nr:M20/M25/M40 family metallo-hydrolase [Deltaproteobacteria bacterium]